MSGTMTPKVTKHTRAPHDGKLIYCPKCASANRVYHFSWCGITCQSCWQMVDKPDWLLERPQAPQDMPPRFVDVEPDMWQLVASDGSFTGIEITEHRDLSGFSLVNHETGYRRDFEHLARAKTRAMNMFRDKHG